MQACSVQACRRSGVQACRRAGVQGCRSAGVQGWRGCRYLQQLHGSVVVQPLLLQCYRRPDVLLVAFEAQPLPQLLLLLQEGVMLILQRHRCLQRHHAHLLLVRKQWPNHCDFVILERERQREGGREGGREGDRRETSYS